MHTTLLDSPALTFALAMLVGILCQAAARHMRIPGIVLLLGTGVAIGPEAANLVRPANLGTALQTIVGFAVAVILFEGGLNLNLRRLRAQALPIRRLLLLGGAITAIGAIVAARLLMHWQWRVAALFGTLIVVTGPTVITPLVRRIRLRPNLATILEAEGIFIDAIGATMAVVVLEVVLTRWDGSFDLGIGGLGLGGIVARLGAGTLVGVAGGTLLALLLRWRNVIPLGLENVVSLAFAVAIFQVSSALVSESGIPAAIAAGMVVGNVHSHARQELVEFKEQLTVLLIATLFVLLAAHVRLAEVLALGTGGLLTTAVLMFVVRPLAVALSLRNTGLALKEKLFLSWLAPRGIVAAAVASLFAQELDEAEITGGSELRALVFLVIAVTVTVQGLTSGLVARLLGLRRAENVGYLLLGANPLARMVATVLQQWGEEVCMIDSNANECRAAQEAGFTVFFGNALEERTLLQAQVDTRAACVALTANESVNFLFARRVRDRLRDMPIYLARESELGGGTLAMMRKLDARPLFVGIHPLGNWQRWIGQNHIDLQVWESVTPEACPPEALSDLPPLLLLPLAGRRQQQKVFLIDGAKPFRIGDDLAVAVPNEKREAAAQWLRAHGWIPRQDIASAS